MVYSTYWSHNTQKIHYIDKIEILVTKSDTENVKQNN